MRKHLTPRFIEKLLFFALCSMLFLAVISFGGFPAHAQEGDNSYDVIAAVNALRVAAGLPEYQINSSLMAAAQAHSDYQASIGQVTHSGADGSRPVDRARTAGYNGFVSENIAGGTSLTVSGAITMWQGDNLHLETMLGTNYTDIGAGVGTSGGRVYYTINVGFLSTGALQSTSTVAAATTAPRGPTPLPVFSVDTVTPYPDGSIIHIVQSGHTLYTIAEAYGVTIQSILDLNNRRLDDQLFVGDKLLIRTAFTPTPTSDVTNTPTPRPATATRRPTRTATLVPPTITPSFTNTVTPTVTPVPALGADPVGNVMLSVVVALLVLGVIFVAAGAILKRRLPSG